MNRTVLINFREDERPKDTEHNNAANVQFKLGPFAEPSPHHVNCPERQEPEGQKVYIPLAEIVCITT